MTRPDLRVQARFGAGPLYDENDPGALVLNSENRSWAQAGDAAVFDITGAMQVRIDLTPTELPLATGRSVILAARASDGDISWVLYATSNVVSFDWSEDGVTLDKRLESTEPVPFSPGERVAIRIDFWPDIGGETQADFYTAPTIDGPWTQLGVVADTPGVAAIWNGSAPVTVGSTASVPHTSYVSIDGQVHHFKLYDGLAEVASPDFSGHEHGTTAFTDDEGVPWTTQGDALITGTVDWVDLSDRLLSAAWGWGRSNELDTFSPGTATIELENDDRALDPENTAGAWHGLLEPRTPFRIQSSADGVNWDDQFCGFVSGGFEQTYRPPGSATCTVTLNDLLAVLEGEVLPQDAYGAEVLSDRPAAFWRLDSTADNQMTDSSGNGHHGTFGEVEADDPLIFGGGGSCFFDHTGDWRGEASTDSLPTQAPATIEAWVKLPRDLTETHAIVVAQRDYAFGSGLVLAVETSANGSPNGELLLNFLGLGSFLKVRGSTRIDDDEPHHVAAVIAGPSASDVSLWVDGEEEALTTVSGTAPGSWDGHRIWTVGNTANNGQGDYGLAGLLDEVAVYPRALTGEQVAAHYAAGLTAYSGERSGTRVARVLDLIDIPDAVRDVDTGDTTVGPADYGGDSAGAYLDSVAESEQGQWFANHHDAGKLTFRGRYDRLTATRSTIAQWAFSDEDDPAALHVEAGSLQVKANGIESIINVVSASWQGGTAVARDASSVARYGPQSRSITTQLPTSAAAEGAGQWLINRYRDPQTRVEGFALAPDADGRLWPAVTGLRVSDRVSLRRHPQQAGAAVTNELYVEGIRHQVTEGLRWRTELNLSHADPQGTAWTWGVSAWGETTTWG